MKSLLLTLAIIVSAQASASFAPDFMGEQVLERNIDEITARRIALGYAITTLGITDDQVDDATVWDAIGEPNEVQQDGSRVYLIYDASGGDCIVLIVVNPNGTVHEAKDVTAENRWKTVTSDDWQCM